MSGGGIPARRAVVRWALRLFLREWRQQILVLGLLTLAVGVTVVGVSAAYNLTPRSDGRFGTADLRFSFTVSDPEALDTYLARAEEWFGAVEVIGHRFVPVPGSVALVEFRAQDPDGPFGPPMLEVLEGRSPGEAGEVAVTNRVASTFGVGIGDSFVLDETSWDVVGLVENPSSLFDDFVLVAPGQDDSPEVSVLANGSEERARSFPVDAEPGPGFVESRGGAEQTLAGAAALGMSTLVLLMVALVAASGFVVVAQRRQRQLGMLAAIGATQKNLRLVMVASGAVVGMIAAVAGLVAGVLGWVAVAPSLESAAAHRIDRLALPWVLVAAGMVLAFAAATGAAWWPARVISRVPITRALSGRPERPKRVHRSVLLAGLLLAAGVVCLAVGIDPRNEEANPLLIVPGVTAIVLGLVFSCPPAIRLLGGVSSRIPVSLRVALRDLSRYQARSGAALAAISVALVLSVSIIISAAAAEHSADEGNLSDRQILVRIGCEASERLFGGLCTQGPFVPERTPAELERHGAAVDRMAAEITDPVVVPLHAAAEPDSVAPNGSERPVVAVGRRVSEDTFRDVGIFYVATPGLLDYHGLDLESFDPETDALVPPAPNDLLGEVKLVNVSGRSGPAGRADDDSTTPVVVTTDLPAYWSAPNSLVTPDAIRRRGWEAIPAGWLLDASAPLTDVQLAAARDIAAEAGLTIESRDEQAALAGMRTGGTIAGMLLALGVVAMTVGLVRGEAAGDLRTLTAAGATSRTRRALAAGTAGALGLLGAVLGTGVAYVALGAGYYPDLSNLSQVPVPNLASIVVGIPVVAAAAGWLLAGREPSVITRHALD